MKRVGLMNKIGCMFIILALLLITFASIRFYKITSKTLFYHRLENRINESAKEFYSKNENEFKDKLYSSVSVNRLVIDNYIKEPIDKQGNHSCTGRTYIYSENNETKYQTCITCGDFKNRYVSDSKYCTGKVDDIIFIEATSSNGKEYNSLLSYDNGEYINGEYVNFNFYYANKPINKFIVKDNNGKEIECTNVYNNSCSINLMQSGSYIVNVFDKENYIIGEQAFSLKMDNTSPYFEFDNNDNNYTYSYIEDNYEYVNKIINLKDNVGIKSVSYTLNGVTKDITNNLTIKENLYSGRYIISVKAVDYANNEFVLDTNEIEIYKSIKMVYPDGKEEYFSVLDGDSYNNLPSEYDWYLDSNRVALISNNTKVKEGKVYSIYGFSK